MSEHAMIDDLEETYDQFTAASSGAIRALALSTIAVCWLFLSAGSAAPATAISAADRHEALAWSLALATASLALDAFQYLVASCISQLYTDMVRTILFDPNHESRPLRASLGWWLALRGSFAREVLVEIDNLGSTDVFSREDAHAKLEQLVSEMWAVEEESRATAPQVAVRKLWALIQRPYLPPILGPVTRTLFWLKSLSCIAAGVILVVYVVDVIL